MENVLKSSICIVDTATIGEALVSITENRKGAAIVVNGDGMLIGVVSDGDIRRALVRGATTMAPIAKVVNDNARFVVSAREAKKEAQRIFDSAIGITIVPVVDENNRVVDVFERGAG